MNRLSSRSRTSSRRLRRLRGVRRRPRSSLTGARTRLRQFRQATMLAVAVTSLLLMLFAPWDADLTAGTEGNGVDGAASASSAEPTQPSSPSAEQQGNGAPAEPLGRAAAEEAARTAETLWQGIRGNLPKFLVVLGILFLAWLTVRLFRPPAARRHSAVGVSANALYILFIIPGWPRIVGLPVIRC